MHNNKSIDDIMKEASLAEVISSTKRDNTNVDVSDSNIKPSNVGRMDINTLMELLKMVEPTKKKDMSTYGGGSLGAVDSPMTLQMLMRTQEPVPQDTSGVGRMNINTLMEILRMQEPTPNR